MRSIFAVVGVLALLLSLSESKGAWVVCLHADGTAALESGAQPCCAPAGGQRHQSNLGFTLVAEDGDCPGCDDLLVPSACGRQQSAGGCPSPPATFASLAGIPPAAAFHGPAALVSNRFLDGASPPLSTPLRI